MDPLSVIASVAGILAAALQATKVTVSVINDIRDAPEDLSALSLELKNLSLLLQTTEQRAYADKLQAEDAMIAQTLNECAEQCTESMNKLNDALRPYSVGRRAGISFVKSLAWRLDKDKLKGLTDKLRDSKASVQFAITVLGYYMTAKTREDIGSARSDVLLAISRTEAMLLDQFQDAAMAGKIKRRLDSDITSIYSGDYVTITLAGHSPTTAPTVNDDLGPPRTLIEAASAGNEAMVLEFLSKGARVMERSNEGSTALHYCAQHNDRAIAQILIEHGALVDMKNNERLTAFDICLRESSHDVAELLIEKGCSVNSIRGDFFEMMVKAVDNSRWERALKAMANSLNGLKDPPQVLHMAIECENTALLTKLLELGFDPNISDQGYRPIHQAVARRRKEDVEILIRKGADVNALLPPGPQRPRGSERRYQLLTTVEARSYTPLLLAAASVNNLSIVMLLLAHGADPNFVLAEANVVLQSVCAPTYLPVATVIVECGANVNFQNAKNGCTALFWAVHCGNTRLVDILLNHGADVNMKTLARAGSFTPLHEAARRGRYEVAMLLIKRGADLSLKDAGGLTALEQARLCKKHTMIQLLSGQNDGDHKSDIGI